MDVSRETDPLGEAFLQQFDLVFPKHFPEVSDEQRQMLSGFAASILRANRHLHLVSQKDPVEEVLKQIVDSAAFAHRLSVTEAHNALDIGSGAGFPGIVLKILRPEINLHSLDSSPGKIEFQIETCSRFGIKSNCICGDIRRFEPTHPFELLLVKAVGIKKPIVKASRRLLTPDGRLVFLEGKTPDPEIQSAVASTKGLQIVSSEQYTIPHYSSTRHLTIICRY